jgi:tRNA threonylcarbamoyladenosine biosynthesis protein TsaB
MTHYLAIETATTWGSVAVGGRGHSLGQVMLEPGSHAEGVLPGIERALAAAGIALHSIEGVVVGDGPGSFTGLRIGLATAKGLLEGRDGVSLHMVPSLMAAAWPHREAHDGSVAALFDALRGEVFAAVYRFDGDSVSAVVPPHLTTMGDLQTGTPSPPGVAVGDGAIAFAEEARRWTGRDPVGPPTGIPTAAALLELLAVEGATRKVDDVAGSEPAYGRAPAAQERWEREHGRPLPGAAGNPG